MRAYAVTVENDNEQEVARGVLLTRHGLWMFQGVVPLGMYRVRLSNGTRIRLHLAPFGSSSLWSRASGRALLSLKRGANGAPRADDDAA